MPCRRDTRRGPDPGRVGLIEITHPEGEQPGRKYPVVYALDGGFGVAGPASRVMMGGARMTPSFTVAIGYANPNGRFMGPREAGG